VHSRYSVNADGSYHGWLKGQKVCEGGSKTVLVGSGEVSTWPAWGGRGVAALVPWYLQAGGAPTL